jgi:hypothetical protein
MEEHNKTKTDLAKAQGIAFSLALDEMKKQDTHASQEVSDYLISMACENAEGMYHFNNNDELVWQVPEEGKNQHIEIVVQDKGDKRFIPSLEVYCKLHDEEDTIVSEFQIPFVWHPFLYHYGINITIPKEGTYFAEVTIKKPTFGRHDETYGKRYQKDVTVKLGPVSLKPGRKSHGEE